jgi:hypothetical protein
VVAVSCQSSNARASTSIGRVAVWQTDRYRQERIQFFARELLAVQMRLRWRNSRQIGNAFDRAVEELRLFEARSYAHDRPNSWARGKDRQPRVQLLDCNEEALRQREARGLSQLRRTWNLRMRALASFVYEFLGRYGIAPNRHDSGPLPESERQLRAWQLPMGDANSAGAES